MKLRANKCEIEIQGFGNKCNTLVMVVLVLVRQDICLEISYSRLEIQGITINGDQLNKEHRSVNYTFLNQELYQLTIVNINYKSSRTNRPQPYQLTTKYPSAVA
jgi:hypothetical protein